MSGELQKRIISDIEHQVQRTKMTVSKLLELYDISRSTFYGWSGKGAITPAKRINYLSVLPKEEAEVVQFRVKHREVGYRKLTWMMNDEGIAALSESAVYAVLKRNDLLGPVSPQGTPAEREYQHKPSKVHEHWHTDIAYIKISGVFYFLIMMLDGYSRYILDWELMSDMLGSSVEDFVQRVKEKLPNAKPKLIHDNGSQFISRDFKMLVSRLDIQQVFTRRNHPQTNGKIERLNGTIRQEALRPHCPQTFAEAWRVIRDFVLFYNEQRLHAGIKFLRPADLFNGIDAQILEQRKSRLAAAKAARLDFNKLNLRRKTISI